MNVHVPSCRLEMDEYRKEGAVNALGTSEVPEPVEHPRSRREAATLITRIGRGLLNRSRKRNQLLRRIAKFKKQATKLQEEEKELTALCLAEIGPIADEVADFSIEEWEMLHEKGTRTIRYGTGEVRLRDVGKPTISVKHNDVAAFFREAKRKGLARKLIRVVREPNIDALHDDLDLAERLRTVSVVYTTKIEVRPRHIDDRLEASVTEDEWNWEIAAPRARQS